MKINTGQGTIPLITLIGIWSISALTSLPGLAVSPILGELSTIFPHATELDIQMLTSLPSLLIIPFVLLAGKLAEKRDFIRLLRVGLWLFAASGVLYLFSSKMWQLMAVSALLGIGAGLIIPLSTGLISRYFTGEYRVKQFGYSSAITNMTLVVATAVTGYLAEVHWRLPFVVYLLPLISLFFLAIMAPGFMLDNIVKLLGNKTKLYSLLAVAVGLLLIWISPTEWLIVPGCILVGLGYGIVQPLIYDKTVDTAIPQKTTLALAFVMVMNYLAILLSPFITDFFQWIFHTGSQEFPFIFNLCITILTMYWAYAKKGDFLFDD